MMIAVTGKYVAAGAEWTPADTRLVQRVNDCRGFLFGVRRDHPVNRAAYTQTGQLGKPTPTLSAHAESRRDLFDRTITLFQVICFGRHLNPAIVLATKRVAAHSRDSLFPLRASIPNHPVEYAQPMPAAHCPVVQCSSRPCARNV